MIIHVFTNTPTALDVVESNAIYLCDVQVGKGN